MHISPETTEYEHLIYEVDGEHVCWLTLDRPEKLNAMNLRLIAELQAGLLRADADEEVMIWTRTPQKIAVRSTSTVRTISTSLKSSPPRGE